MSRSGLAMRIQQYSGPVMAKGLEDTAFYRYNRLLALNEVGGSPDRFGVTVSAFHYANAERASDWPMPCSVPPPTTPSGARTLGRG